MGGVMDDVTFRLIFSAADETIAQLDQLHLASRERQMAWRRTLDDATARLGDSSVPFMEPDAPGPPAARSSAARVGTVAAETPFVALPQRTTHGGRWGPAMVRKLTAEALAKGKVW